MGSEKSKVFNNLVFIFVLNIKVFWLGGCVFQCIIKCDANYILTKNIEYKENISAVYSSFHKAFLFSTKAVIPSWLSFVPKVKWSSLFSTARPSYTNWEEKRGKNWISEKKSGVKCSQKKLEFWNLCSCQNSASQKKSGWK